MSEIILVEGNDLVHTDFTFTFSQGEFSGRTFEGSLHSYCENPVCTCNELVLKFRELPAASEQWKYYLTLNVRTKKLVLPKKTQRKEQPELYAFASAFVGKLTKAELKQFHYLFFALKADCMKKHKDLSSLEVDFSKHDYQEGALICYQQIFPYIKPLTVIIEDDQYVVDEYYCISPSCSCTNVLLSFHQVLPDTATSILVCSIYYNYKTHRWTTLEDDVDYFPTELKKFTTAYSTTFPGFRERVKKNHHVMRKLYKSYLERTRKTSKLQDLDTVYTPSKSPGRNDPCPCGSGRKYKHCCGA